MSRFIRLVIANIIITGIGERQLRRGHSLGRYVLLGRSNFMVNIADIRFYGI